MASDAGRRRGEGPKAALAAVGVAALAVAGCAALPLVVGLAGSAALGAGVGLGAGVLGLAGLVTFVVVRHRRAAGCSFEGRGRHR